MHFQARYFGDENAFREIMESENPRRAKAIGNRIENFSSEVWDRVGEIAMALILRAKFHQNVEAGRQLISLPAHVILAEASTDHRWGTGLPITHPNAGSTACWTGRSRLGALLMRTKNELSLVAKIMTGLNIHNITFIFIKA